MPYSILIIDDERTFDPARLDIREGDLLVHARTSFEGLRRLRQRAWDELWLDRDLGGDDTIAPVVKALLKAIAAGQPIEIGRIVVHTNNSEEGRHMVEDLSPYYRVERLFDTRPFLAKPGSAREVRSPRRHSAKRRDSKACSDDGRS
jgi:hypothetical protein